MRNAQHGGIEVPEHIRRQIYAPRCQVGESELRPVSPKAVLHLQKSLPFQDDDRHRVVQARQFVQISSGDFLDAGSQLFLGTGSSDNRQVLGRE